MPTYDHTCSDEQCQFCWEDFYSIKADPPKICPKCGQETAQRVISGGSGKGKVELYGQDLVDHCKSEAAKLQRDASQKESTYANLLGESNYQSLQTKLDKQKRDRGR